jgi:N-acetylneuraminic acid mutarotase
MSTPRNAVRVGVVNGILYAVGGDTDGGGTGYLASAKAYDPAVGAWSPIASMSTPRDTHAVGVVDGILYAVGGQYPDQVALSSVEAYDPKSNTWTAKAPMPTPRYSTAAGVVNGILYVVGGQNATTAFSTVEAYDPKTNTWSTKAPMLTARLGPAVAVVNGILYAMGGIAGGCPSPCSIVEAYDPTKDMWTTVAPMLTPRYLLAVGVVNGTIYAVGGINASGYLSTVESMAASKCTTGPCIETPSAGASPQSHYVALSGTGTPGDALTVFVSAGSVVVDSEGYWEALPNLTLFSLTTDTIQVQSQTTSTLSNVINVYPEANGLPDPGDDTILLTQRLFTLRHADIFVAASPSFAQEVLYGPNYTHTALYLGGDDDGTPLVAEAVTAAEAGAYGQVRNLTLEQSLIWVGERIAGFTPRSALASATRDDIVDWAIDTTNQGLPYWSLIHDFGLILAAGELYGAIVLTGGNPSQNPRFLSFINQINANKNSSQKFICSTLVWRAYLEGTGHTLDISDPNNMSASPGSILGQFPLGFIDQLRPAFVVPETFVRSPKLTQIF